MRSAVLIAACVAVVAFSADGFAQGRGQPNRPGNQNPNAHNQGGGSAAPMQREATETDTSQLLDDDLLSDPAKLEAARAKATQEPPQTTDLNVLTQFYFERAEAARISGNQQQNLL